MKKLYAALIVGFLVVPTGCQDFLDVNTNPNAPQSVSANLYLPPMIHWMFTAPQYDGRFIARYTQELTLPSTSLSSWDRMGYDPSSDNGAEQWRDVYWSLGQNLVDMNTKAEAEQRWDLLGVGVLMKAWGWQVLTDLHGELPIKEAIDPSRTVFDYD
ncbi:MAG TPA: SusD/RagB family nutrient-binding outer membrane lipoprotein, partial [Gemmatimonadaceae bacterium]|nr:SusD/RagB family nutrient-binding outer membrane lipoprotein [Gemmatimonadaceae bacterium]